MPVVLFITFNAHAIIIRHDVDDKKYLELGGQYSTSVAYIRDGGCAATLIDPNWLLTAAHCVISKDGIKRSLTEATHLGDKYPIESVTAHPQFDRKSLHHDIALIQLKKPIEKGSPVKLYKHKNEKGKPVVNVGSGYSGNGLEGITKREYELRGATNTAMGVSEKFIKFNFDKPGTRKVTRLEGISGPADSGGPAFIIIDSQRYVAGVSSRQLVSVFKKEAHYGVKELYTRVSTYYPWIESIINQDVEQLLGQLVNQQREYNGLIGLGAVIIQNDKIIGPFVSGERKKDSEVFLSDNDKWHIGSITKPIAATMIARLVEKGELSWDTTIKDAFLRLMD